jgi:hypothetical protein
MRKRTFAIRLIIAVVCFCTGCKKDFVAINTDPDQIKPDQINYNYLFTSAQMQTSGNVDGNGFEDWRNNLIYSGCMVQHLSSTLSYWDGDKYLYSAPYNSATWDVCYPNSIANIVEVVTHTREDSTLYNFYQIARIFRVYMFQRITDMYGDCPYSQAGLGYISGITSPQYDRQQDIYMDMLNELSDAATRLDPAKANTLGAADLLYGGDPAAWKKFAFSEMVRLAMRLSKVDPATAEKWVQTAVNGGVMNSNTDNAILQHQALSGTPVANGTGLVLIANDPNGYRVSKTFVDFLRGSGDPRLSYLTTVCANPGIASDKGDTNYTHQLGQPNGYDPPNSGTAYDLTKAPGWPGDPNKYSIVNRYTFARLDAPSFFLTYGQTQLLLAEAAQRGWINGDPAALYASGVVASMRQLGEKAGAGPSDPQISAWVAANPYDPAHGLEQINDQYWVAGFMDENECWANWRRSGYPALTPVTYPGNITNGSIPRRFTYPLSEATSNAANYNAAVSRLSSGDKMVSRVWWDKKS